MASGKKIFWITLSIFILPSLWVFRNYEHIQRFPQIMPSFYAKQMCSCLYVLQRNEKFCHNLSRQYISISDFKIDSEQKTVKAMSWGKTAFAKFTSSKHGCVLDY